MWEMQKSSTDESIPEDARSVLEHPNLKRGPVGAMGPARVTCSWQEGHSNPLPYPLLRKW